MASTGEALEVGRGFSRATTRPGATSWLAPAVIGLVPVLLVLAATRSGIGMSPDSKAYTLPLRTGSFDFYPAYDLGQPLVTWMTGAGVGAVALNCVAVWCNVLVSYALAMTVTGSRRVAVAVAAWLSVSVATTQVYSMLWSEPLFVLATNAVLLALVHTARRGELTPRLAVAIIFAANVAGALRYAGMFLVPVIAVALLAYIDGPLRRRLAVTAACTVTLVVAWVHNLLSGEAIMGPRPPRVDSVADVFGGLPFAAAGYVQNSLSRHTSWSVGIAALILGALLLWTWVRTDRLGAEPVILLAWVMFYVGSLMASSLATDIDGVGFRLSAPVFSATLVLVFSAAAAVLPSRPLRWALAISVVWMIPTTAWWALRAGTGAAM